MQKSTGSSLKEINKILERNSRYNDLKEEQIGKLHYHNFKLYDARSAKVLYSQPFRKDAVVKEKKSGILRRVTSHAFNRDMFWATEDIYAGISGVVICDREEYSLVWPKTKYVFLPDLKKHSITYVVAEMD